MKKNQQQASNEAQAIEKAFFAPAKMVPTMDLLPNNLFNSYNNSCVIVETSEGDKIVNFCSDGYALVHNSDLFPVIESKLNEEGFEFDVTRKVSLSSQFVVDYTLKGFEYQIGKNKNDIIIPAIKVQHSYNGKLSYSVSFGFYSVLRDNMIWGGGSNITLSHSAGNIEDIIDGTVEAMVQYIESFEETKSIFEGLYKAKVLNFEAKIEEVIENTGFFKVADLILEKIEGEKDFKTGNNEWAL